MPILEYVVCRFRGRRIGIPVVALAAVAGLGVIRAGRRGPSRRAGAFVAGEPLRMTAGVTVFGGLVNAESCS